MAHRKLKRNIASLQNQPRLPPDSFPDPQENHPSPPTPPHKPSPCPNSPADGNENDMSFDEENPLYKRVDSSKEYWQGSDDEELETYSTGGGLSTDIIKFQRRHLMMPKRQLLMHSMCALWMSFNNLWIIPGGLWVPITSNYCSISFNSTVMHHAALPNTEM